MKDQYTLTPWHVTHRPDLKTVSVFGPEGTRRDGDTLHAIACFSTEGPFGHEAEANANLIAAAPELLSACRLAAVRLEGGTEAEKRLNVGLARILRQVIAKATTA